jgi:hypothetical protein
MAPVLGIFVVWMLGFAGAFSALQVFDSPDEAVLFTFRMMLGGETNSHSRLIILSCDAVACLADFDLDGFQPSEFIVELRLLFALIVLVSVIVVLNMTISNVSDTWADVKASFSAYQTALRLKCLVEVRYEKALLQCVFMCLVSC